MANRKWDDETIAGALRPVVAELGRMPTRTELIDRGLAAVWSAMRRNGGTRVWAVRATEWAGAGPAVAPVAEAPPLEAPPAASVEERIRMRAYFLAIEGVPGGPEDHWLRAEREVAA
jgi:DUF2934 family protein